VNGAHLVGDVMLDANLSLAPLARERSGALTRAGVAPGGYLLVTLHREASVREVPLARVAEALNALTEPVVFPAHPRTATALVEYGIELAGHVRLLPPAGYLDFAALASQARLVLTDSGGLQEETTALGIPCLTLRENTERPITVEEGTNEVVGTDPARILSVAREVLAGRGKQGRTPPRWGGKAGERVAEALLGRL
jgi:UDP-N-acetylglucosamine 2-epimerase (non-hydrolysing)